MSVESPSRGVSRRRHEVLMRPVRSLSWQGLRWPVLLLSSLALVACAEDDEFEFIPPGTTGGAAGSAGTAGSAGSAAGTAGAAGSSAGKGGSSGTSGQGGSGGTSAGSSGKGGSGGSSGASGQGGSAGASGQGGSGGSGGSSGAGGGDAGAGGSDAGSSGAGGSDAGAGGSGGSGGSDAGAGGSGGSDAGAGGTAAGAGGSDAGAGGSSAGAGGSDAGAGGSDAGAGGGAGSGGAAAGAGGSSSGAGGSDAGQGGAAAGAGSSDAGSGGSGLSGASGQGGAGGDSGGAAGSGGSGGAGASGQSGASGQGGAGGANAGGSAGAGGSSAAACLPGGSFDQIMSLQGQSPFCVVRVHATGLATFGTSFHANWGRHGGPMTTDTTGGKAEVRRWALPSDVQGTTSGAPIKVTVAGLPPGIFFGAALDVPFNSWTLLPYAGKPPAFQGELLAMSEDLTQVVARSPVNGFTAGTALPTRLLFAARSPVLLQANASSSTGLYALDPCDASTLRKQGCGDSSKLDGWLASPGPVATDASGNLFAVQSTTGGDEELRAYTQAEASGSAAVSGYAIFSDKNVPTSLAALGDPDGLGGLVVTQSSNASQAPQPARVHEYAIDQAGFVAIPVDNGGFAAVKAGVSPRVFRDDQGLLWVALDAASGAYFVALQRKLSAPGRWSGQAAGQASRRARRPERRGWAGGSARGTAGGGRAMDQAGQGPRTSPARWRPPRWSDPRGPRGACHRARWTGPRCLRGCHTPTTSPPLLPRRGRPTERSSVPCRAI